MFQICVLILYAFDITNTALQCETQGSNQCGMTDADQIREDGIFTFF